MPESSLCPIKSGDDSGMLCIEYLRRNEYNVDNF